MLLAEERRGGGEQPLPCGDLQVDQSSQREVHLGDFFEVDLLAEAAQAVQFVLGQDQRSRLTQCAPLLAVELDIRAGFARRVPSAQLAGASELVVPWSGEALRASQARVRTIRVHSRIVLGATYSDVVVGSAFRARALGSALWIQIHSFAEYLLLGLGFDRLEEGLRRRVHR